MKTVIDSVGLRSITRSTLGIVHAFVEEVHGEQHAKAPLDEVLHRTGSIHRTRSGVHRCRTNARCGEVFCHEDRVFDRHAEAERGAAVVLTESFDGPHRPLGGVDASGEPLRVVGAARREQRLVVHDGVGDAEVAERHQPAQRDRLEQADLVGEVAVAQLEQVAVVAAERGGGQAEQEPR
ncbi:MAG: hypothetical protein V9G23_13755 [Giesbergeria sp.]